MARTCRLPGRRLRMAVVKKLLASALVLAGVAGLLLLGGIVFNGTVSALSSGSSDPARANADKLFLQGRDVFRFETFGDEAVWGGVLGLHKAIEGSELGGVGAGISPKQALALGLKVDATAIPADLAAAIKAGNVNLDDPAVTVQLLKLNAVVGVKGVLDGGRLVLVGDRKPARRVAEPGPERRRDRGRRAQPAAARGRPPHQRGDGEEGAALMG